MNFAPSPHLSSPLREDLSRDEIRIDLGPALDPDLLASMTERGRERLLRRLRFLTLTAEGVEISEALRLARLNITPRSGQVLLQRFAAGGVPAVLDRRSLSRVEGRNPRPVRTPQVEALIRALATKGTTAVRPIQRAITPVCRVLGLPAPSPSTIRRVLATWRPAAVGLASGADVQRESGKQAAMGHSPSDHPTPATRG